MYVNRFASYARPYPTGYQTAKQDPPGVVLQFGIDPRVKNFPERFTTYMLPVGDGADEKRAIVADAIEASYQQAQHLGFEAHHRLCGKNYTRGILKRYELSGLFEEPREINEGKVFIHLATMGNTDCDGTEGWLSIAEQVRNGAAEKLSMRVTMTAPKSLDDDPNWQAAVQVYDRVRRALDAHCTPIPPEDVRPSS